MTNADTTPAQGSPFWRFSLQFYRQPAVADACIALQEEAGVDVNLLLFLLWHAAQQRAFSPSEIAAIEARIGPWREATVVPLRAVRRALKSPPALVAPATAEAFRTRIKAVELEAERLQQEAMYELAHDPEKWEPVFGKDHAQTQSAQASPLGRELPSTTEAARVNVAAYEAMRAVAFPKPAVDTLLAAFAKLHSKGE
jgi:uncharacterized protein (TIGR02444 family)